MFTSKKTRSQKKLSFRLLTITLFLISIFSFYGAALAATWYVNGDIGTSGNGTTWDEAFPTLQDAIDAASEDDDIWVKKGTYLLSSQINVDKTVGIYGGFAGDETQRNQRDWANNMTTIDGQDSVYHCFYITSDATIDGLTITGGNANGSSPDYIGGGINIYQSSPSIANCIISENSADFGGGIYNRESSPTITNCVLTSNSANENGGGIRNYKSSPKINNCTISENTADFGGGIINYQSTPTITDCTFSANSATKNGGGMYNDDNALPTITNCTFTDNTAEFGGAIFNNDNTTPTITNCTLRGNSATNSGGGMYNDDNASPTLTNCSLSDNSATYGGALYNNNSSPAIVNCTLSENSATSYGGGIRNKNSSTPTITNSILWNNTAPDGPEIYDDTSNPIITYCDIQGGNYAGQGNINADPLFVDPSNNNFHLQATSPCIDKGSNSATGIPDTDFEGDQRILDGDGDGTATVDMGADEHASLVTADGDVAPFGNRDGKVDVGDALVALRFALGLETPSQEDVAHGDVAPLDASGQPDPDGIINIGDALVILRMALNLVSLEPNEINGIWALYTTITGETREDGPMIMVLLESGTTLSLETMDLDGTWINGTGTINGTQVSLSWEDKEKTVSLTGTVTNGAMSGTWTDTSGGSGTWRAERVLEIGEAEITFPETGDELIKIEEEFGFGSAVFYGTETEQGPALPLTGFTITTTEGDCVVSLDDKERPVEMTLGTMEVTFTYNFDDSFNYEMKEDGVLIYSGAAISTGEEGQSGSRSWTGDMAPLSVARYYGAVDSIRTAHVRSGDDEPCFEDVVRNEIARAAEFEYNIPENHPFVQMMQQNPQLLYMMSIDVISVLLQNRLQEKHGEEIANEALRVLNNYIEDQLLETTYDSIDNEWDDYNGGRDYDFDKDGFTENQGDFNDRNKFINPDAKEVCNGIDDNCNNQTDEGVKNTYYLDSDGDGHGNLNITIEACKAPDGWVTDSTDCNDNDKYVYSYQLWEKDADGDGYADVSNMMSCSRPEGYKLLSELTGSEIDCDDDDRDEQPGQVWYKDTDDDRYTDGSAVTSCLRPEGYKVGNDLIGSETYLCDTDENINPGVTEVCDDNKDNDCDTLTDCDDPDCATHPSCQQQCPDPKLPQPCHGYCIPTGADCCDGGGWCSAGTKCWGDDCCPIHRICDDIFCIPEGSICCNFGTGGWCTPALPKCCPGWCCPKNCECCGGTCCIPGSHCSGGVCVAD